jgi:hypothetical protein
LSFNGGELAITGGINYDDSGVYIGGTITAGQTKRFGPKVLTSSMLVMRRFESDITLDVGLSPRRFSECFVIFGELH